MSLQNYSKLLLIITSITLVVCQDNPKEILKKIRKDATSIERSISDAVSVKVNKEQVKTVKKCVELVIKHINLMEDIMAKMKKTYKRSINDALKQTNKDLAKILKRNTKDKELLTIKDAKTIKKNVQTATREEIALLKTMQKFDLKPHRGDLLKASKLQGQAKYNLIGDPAILFPGFYPKPPKPK